MQYSRPTVSVVIPCYNAEAFVAEAVASVWEQTYPVEEVVCIDDGSTDGTLEVLRSLQERSKALFVVLSQPNGGPSAARNLGLARGTGDYVQFLDADDLLLPDKIEHQVALIEASESVPDLVAAAHEVVFPYADRREVVDVEPNPWLGLFCSRLGITSANLYRREAVLRVGGWNEEMKTSEDPELAFRLLRRGPHVVLDPVPKTVLRRREDSQWNADKRASLRGWLRLRMEFLAWTRSHGTLTQDQAHVVEGKVFEVIRSVHTYDPALAEEALAMLSATFRPELDRHGRVYPLLYRTLGFRRAQRFHPYWLQFGTILRPS